MKPVLILARMTWTELIRNRFVVVLAFLALLLLVLATFLGTLSLDEQTRMLVHLGFASFHVTLVGLALFLGSWTLQAEIEKQTCLLVLSRPVSRTQFLIGKWLGALSLITFFWLVCGLLHLILLEFQFLLSVYFLVHLTLLIESFTVLSLAFFFASFLRPLLALSASFALLLAGHWREDLQFFAKRTKSVFFEQAAEVSVWIFPPFDRLEIRSVHFLTNADSVFPAWTVTHLLFWSTLLMFCAAQLWRRRDLV
ncbi:MAG: ABC transporter permease [Bdellovibrio sp.]|jgi:Cu-processing system permease protein